MKCGSVISLTTFEIESFEIGTARASLLGIMLNRIKTIFFFIRNRARLRAAGYRLCMDGTIVHGREPKPPRLQVNDLGSIIEFVPR